MQAEINDTEERSADLSIEFSYEPVGCSVRPIRYNPDVCIHCNQCVKVCQVDILMPNPDPDQPNGYGVPIVAYPGECYYCGCCVMACPKKDEGAITLHHPLMNVAKFVPVKKNPQ